MTHPMDLAILNAIRTIPRGRVSTYGWIASLAGYPGQPRLVGYALHRSRDPDLPWHRVVNARGEISPRAESEWVSVQHKRLRREGIRFNERGRIDLTRYGWRGDSSPR